MEEFSESLFKRDFESFVNSDWQTNVWFEYVGVSVYIRNGHRFLNEEMVPCFDIANINVEKEKQGKGIFTTIRGVIEEKGCAVYVENIYSERLLNNLLFYGYAIGDCNHEKEYPVSVIKLPKEN